MTHPGVLRPTWVEVDLAAIENNARVLTSLASPSALCAVVKADGYGHGAVEVARAALAGGATWLAVALVDEGVALRDAGLDAPVLVLSEPAVEAMPEVVARRLTPTVYSRTGIEALSAVCEGTPGDDQPVHLKVDTGMHRVGCDVEDAPDLARFIGATPGIRLEGIFTHFAVADAPEHPSNNLQMRRFEKVLAALDAPPPIVHTANTAATLAFSDERRSLVRPGGALYGVSPSPTVELPAALRPAMSLKSQVSSVRLLAAGERISYGHNYELSRESYVATVPVGYADGLPRGASMRGAEVLLGGHRHPIAGAVTMDQVMVDCGDHPVRPGDLAVLLGSQGQETIKAEDLAELVGTISYEIVTGIGPRVPRRYRSNAG